MKRPFNALSLSVLLLASPLAMAAEPTAWEQIKSFAHERKSEAVAEGQRMIAATDRKLDELKQEVAKSTGETKKAHEKNLQELQAKRKAAQAELNKMQQSAAKTWDATKEGFARAYQDLSESYDKARAAATAK